MPCFETQYMGNISVAICAATLNIWTTNLGLDGLGGGDDARKRDMASCVTLIGCIKLISNSLYPPPTGSSVDSGDPGGWPEIRPVWLKYPGARTDDVNRPKDSFRCCKHLIEVGPRGYIGALKSCFVRGRLICSDKLFCLWA